MTALYQSAFLSEFQCLGGDCADTCCKGWGMQLTQETVDKYKAEAPELLEAVTSGEAEHIMKRDPETDYCVKFDNGWCGIHATRGTDFLGDACHFFPRVTRKLGDAHLMTASLSCPEVARLSLFADQTCAIQETETDRLPFSLRDYIPAELNAEQALSVHQAFVQSVNDAPSAARAVARLRSVSESLKSIDVASWAMAVPFYLTQADARLPAPEGVHEDPFNVLHALQGLLCAAKQTGRARLDATIDDMCNALHVTLDPVSVSIKTGPDSWQMWQQMLQEWDDTLSSHFDAILKRWLQVQLSVALYPFAGFGETLTDRATIMGVRFATVKLALMSACRVKGGVIDEEQSVRVIQSLARFLDHLADPTLTMQIYTETGWSREARLRSLVGDA